MVFSRMFDREHGGETAPLDALHLAARGVLEDVSGLVASRPASIRAGHVGAVHERAEIPGRLLRSCRSLSVPS